jgi:hypothetical protein
MTESFGVCVGVVNMYMCCVAALSAGCASCCS